VRLRKTVTLQAVETAAKDTSVSDKKFFKMLSRYWRDQERQAIKEKRYTVSIDSPEFQEMEAETERIRNMVFVLRPAVGEMVHQHVLKQHAKCCGPKAKK